MEIIQANGATLAGVLISLDRQERGRGEISAIQEVERDYNCKVISVITLKDLIAYLEKQKWRNIWRRLRPIAKSLAFNETRRMKNSSGVILLQLCGNWRPAGVKIIRWAVFKLAADKA